MDQQHELAFAKSVVELGYVTPEQLRECLQVQLSEEHASARLKRTPDGTEVRGVRPLSAILIEKGYLTQENLTELRDRQSPPSRPVPGVQAAVFDDGAPKRTPSSPSNRMTVRPPSPLKRASRPSEIVKSDHETRPTVPVQPGAKTDVLEAPRPAPDMPEEVTAAARDPKNQFGKFILVNQVGAGGFGAVYRAWQRDLTRWVAIKFLHSDDPQDIDRFMREAQTAAKLTHPNIVAIYEVSVIGKRPYIAMEYVDGRPMSKVRVPPDQALRAMILAARGVQAAHDAGVVHRDLKPGNLLYDGKGRVCVMDFGLARHVDAAGSASMSETIAGTPAYMSPEQAHGNTRVTAQSDVYSLGATLYDLLTGHPPFEGRTPYEVIRKVIDQDPVPPRQIARRVHPEIETIILKALEKDTEKRYRTADEFADDIERHLKGEPILAQPVGPVVRAWKRVKRNPVVSIALLVAALAVSGGATFGVVALVREARSARREATAAKEAQLAMEKALAAERERAESEAKRAAAERERASAERAAGRIAQMVSAVERLRVEYYRPSFTSRLLETYLAELEATINDLRRELPDRPEPDYLLGRVYLEAEELDKADAALQRSLKIDPDFLAARGAKARVLFESLLEYVYLGLVHTEGFEHFRRLVKTYEAEVQAAMAGTWARMPGTATDRELLVVLRTFSSLQGERMLEACRSAWEKTRDEEFLRYQALPAIILGKQDEGIAALTEAIALRPGWATLYVYRAVLHVTKAQKASDLGSALAAEKDLAKALALNPKHHLARRCNGFKFRVLNKYDEALKEYDEAVRLRPTPLYLIERAELHRLRKQYDEALADANEVVRRWPDLATGWSTRGMIRLASGDAKGAEADGLEAMQRRPHHIVGRYLVADALMRRGLGDEAIATAGWLVEKQRDVGDGWGLRGIMRKRWADELRKRGDGRWKDEYLTAREDLDVYVGGRLAQTQDWMREAKKARAEIEEALKQD